MRIEKKYIKSCILFKFIPTNFKTEIKIYPYE